MRYKRHRTTFITEMRNQIDVNTSVVGTKLTLCFLSVEGSPPNAPRLTNRVTRPASSSQTKGSLSQNIGGWPAPAEK